MKEPTEQWALVQLAFDERRDPLDDPLVSAWLLEDELSLIDVLRLRATLDGLQQNRPVAESRWPQGNRRRALAIAAGFAGLVIGAAFGLEALAPSRSPAHLPLPIVQQSNADAQSRVLELSLSVVTVSQAERLTTHSDGRSFTRHREHFLNSSSAPPGIAVETVLSTHVTSRSQP